VLDVLLEPSSRGNPMGLPTATRDVVLVPATGVVGIWSKSDAENAVLSRILLDAESSPDVSADSIDEGGSENGGASFTAYVGVVGAVPSRGEGVGRSMRASKGSLAL
jgi:hypothetical protein